MHYVCQDINSQNGLSSGVNVNRQGGSKKLDSNNSKSQDKSNNKWVINLSSISLTEAQKSVLANRPNYSITPNTSQMLNILQQ